MSDTTTLPGFTPQPPMFEAPVGAPVERPGQPPKRRGRPPGTGRAARKPAASAVVAKPEKPAQTAKHRGRPASKPQPSADAKLSAGALRVPMSALVGITADEIALLEKMATAVHALPKRRRHLVAQALGRIFA